MITYLQVRGQLIKSSKDVVKDYCVSIASSMPEEVKELDKTELEIEPHVGHSRVLEVGKLF